MAHFNFVISQNAKWGHADFYIDCHRMTVPENILLQKSTACRHLSLARNKIQNVLWAPVDPALAVSIDRGPKTTTQKLLNRGCLFLLSK